MIELVSDLGGGKTTFTKGLAKGIDSDDAVTSPTFTLNNIYRGSKLTIYHFDFYRLAEAGIMNEELAEVLRDSKAVTVVEWGDIVQDVLPQSKLTIHITASGETSRQYKINVAKDLHYLVEGLSV